MSIKNTSDAVTKVYRLLNGSPLSYTLPSRNHHRFPLMYFDEEKKISRALRYAVNQKSPFEDEQDSNPIIEPIVFEDGLLIAQRTNQVLQQFLHYHPLRGVVFAEVDKQKDAAAEVADINYEIDALIAAKQLNISQIEMMTRVMFGKDPSMVSTDELKRDILIFAKANPKDFLRLLNDPELEFDAKVSLFFEQKLIQARNQDKEVWYTTATNKRKMLSVPFEETPVMAVSRFLRNPDNADALTMLESLLEQ